MMCSLSLILLFGFGGFVVFKNVVWFLMLVELLCVCGLYLLGIGVFYGYLGYGKIYLVIYVQNVIGVLWVEVGDSWMCRKFL